MPSSPEDRLRVAAVINALKAAGIRVKNWKNFLNGETTHGETYKPGRRSIFAFGRDLALLPQCHLPEMGGTVPRFLVDACEFLSQHLHTEGLFRKTGSLSRIRALRVGLEQGEPVFSPPLSSSLQPCDVASLLKQFLRELPSPLIPPELQGALCRAQGLGPEAGREGGRGGATLLVTALFPPAHARALRYLCTFLRSAAQRSSENRMEVGSLALVIAPNLLQSLAAGCKLTVGTERLLDRQAAVIAALITHAERIGVIPSVVMEALSSSSSAEGAGFQEKAGLGVYRSLRRQRRRSVGEMFVDAFSKLKTGRTPGGPSQPPDTRQGQQVAATAVPPSPSTTKRKASEDTLPGGEGSAKKRRSIHDLREDNPRGSLSCSEDSEPPHSPTPSLCSITSALEASDEHRLLGPQTTSAKKRTHRKNTKRVKRVLAPEDRAQRRRRSLRFFTTSSWTCSSATPSDPAEAGWLLDTKPLTDNSGEPLCYEGGGPFQAPVILIDGPGGAVVGTEVEDDPEALNCSFVESPRPARVTSRRVWTAAQLEGAGGVGCADEGWVRGGGATAEAGEETDGPVGSREAGKPLEGVEGSDGQRGPRDWRAPVVDVFRRVSRGYRPPRRSVSLPEVTSEQAGGEGAEEEEVEGEEEGGSGDRDGEFGGSHFHKCARPVEEPLRDANGLAWRDTGSEQSVAGGEGGGGGEAEEVLQNGLDKCKETEREKKGKKEEKKRARRDAGGKGEESGLGFVRSHQRMSVADRMRRFNLLSALLRASRPPPAPPAAQRGPVRLRRQGARRFGRSISHEGVAGLLLEQSTAEAPLQEPSQELLKHREPVNPVNPHKPLNPQAILHPLNPHDPVNLLNPRYPQDPLNHLNPEDPLNPSNTHNPSDPHNPLHSSNPQNPHNPLDPLSPVERQNLLDPLEPLNPLELPSKPPKPQLEHPNPGEWQRRHCQLLKEPPSPPLDPGRPPQQPKPQPLQEPQEGKIGTPVPDLHELLELQLHIQHLQPEPPASQNALCSPPPSPLQAPAENGGSPCFLSLPAPLPHHTEARSRRASSASEGIDSPPEIAASIGCSHCHDNGLNETGSGGGEPDPSLPPLALHFRAPTTRRRYRDSPRWPIPEIRITTMTPFQL